MRAFHHSVSRRDIDHALSQVKRHETRLVKEQAKKETMTNQLVQSAEIGGGALLSGVITGRYGAVSLGPVPVDLAAAVVLHGLGFIPAVGKSSAMMPELLHNVGDGFLAAYLVKLGVSLGTTLRIKSGQSAFTTSGEGGLPAPAYPMNYMAQGMPGYGMPLSDADLAQAFQQQAAY